LADIDPELALNLKEEIVDPYKTTLSRLRYAGLRIPSADTMPIPAKHL
jgi:hypothetical protein